VQVQQFNTLYQLWAHVHEGRFPERAARLLLRACAFARA